MDRQEQFSSRQEQHHQQQQQQISRTMTTSQQQVTRQVTSQQRGKNQLAPLALALALAQQTNKHTNTQLTNKSISAIFNPLVKKSPQSQILSN